VAVANDEGRLEIDVQRERDANEDSAETKYAITFDNRAPIDAASSKNAGAGIYDHWLGNYAAVAPIFAKARQLTILITAPRPGKKEPKSENAAKAAAVKQVAAAKP